MKKSISILLLLKLTICLLTGCSMPETQTTLSQNTTEENPEPVVYIAMMYDNQGNNFLNVEGNNFTITPNKIKQYGYNTDGSWTSYYETSSIMSINIDGNYIHTCGSSIIFKDKRLDMYAIPKELDTKPAEFETGYTTTVDGRDFDTYLGLTNWWYDVKPVGQDNSKIIIIQSQEGYNIGAFIGSDVHAQVSETLPKTTLITIDGMPLYIHKCNLTIIDTALMDKTVEFTLIGEEQPEEQIEPSPEIEPNPEEITSESNLDSE